MLGPIGKPAGPISAKAQLRGLPGKPAGSITAQGVLVGSRLELAVAAIRAGDGGLKVTIEHADWKSAHAQGALPWPAGTRFPLGRLDLRMARLDDLRSTDRRANYRSDRRQRGHIRNRRPSACGFACRGAGYRARRLASTGPCRINHDDCRSADPSACSMRVVVAAATLASGIGASVQIGLAGPEDAFRLTADAEVRDPGGGNLSFATTGTVNAETRVAALSTLQATWKGENLHLAGAGTCRVWQWSDPRPSSLGACGKG